MSGKHKLNNRHRLQPSRKRAAGNLGRKRSHHPSQSNLRKKSQRRKNQRVERLSSLRRKINRYRTRPRRHPIRSRRRQIAARLPFLSVRKANSFSISNRATTRNVLVRNSGGFNTSRPQIRTTGVTIMAFCPV